LDANDLTTAAELRRKLTSSKALTVAAHASFLPIGVATVLLGPMLPALSEHWSLDYSQAGLLFPVQYVASTVAVSLSGALVAWRGYRFAINAGLLLMAAGLGLLLSGSKLQGMICIAAYGAGIGLAVPAANLLVAEVNPARQSAALNLLNFSWSVGAVACPFLVSAFTQSHQLSVLLWMVGGASLLVTAGIAAMPSSIAEPVVARGAQTESRSSIDWKNRALLTLAMLFTFYVGTENGVGFWVASYAKSLGSLTVSMALIIPSFFYAAIMLGRWLAPMLLRAISDVRLAQAGLLISCAGIVCLMSARALAGVATGAALAGLGLSSVYPIIISLLSRKCGTAASRVGSLMFTLSYLGGGFFPWLAGVASKHTGTLKVGLAVPLAGSVLMYALFQREWRAESVELVA
jgi:FHS family glucose/mannose:H+ symporter-like MFS transporter